MTAAKDAYTAALKAAAAAQQVTTTVNQMTAQETINAAGCNVGDNLQTGNYATFAAAVKAANQAKRDADFLALQAAQATAAAARETLRAADGTGPF